MARLTDCHLEGNHACSGLQPFFMEAVWLIYGIMTHFSVESAHFLSDKTTER
jgi:hypothetical protein